MHLPANTLLHGGTYRIVRFISSGGFGCTYEAEHILLEKRVAVKEFFAKDFCNRDETTSRVTVGTVSKQVLAEKLRHKFIDEAKALCKLHHPGIVSVSDVFEENGTAYFVMDYVDGRSLGEIVREDGPLSEARALRYILHVSRALQYVHENNRLHLDIKPGNIMIDSDDNPVLIDFGASKQYDEEAGENTSTLMGKTPGYAPPEQMSNSVVRFLPATDIYALGATLYKLLTGITPPDALLRISGEQIKSMPASISASTRNAVSAAMQMSKGARPQSMSEFIDMLLPSSVYAVEEDETQFDMPKHVTPDKSAPSGQGPQSQSTVRVSSERKRPRSAWQRYLVMFACAAAAVMVGLFLILDWRSPRAQSVPDPELAAVDTAVVYEEAALEQRRKDEEARKAEAALKAQAESERNRISGMFEMVYVAGGTFMMGASSSDSEASADEKPSHSVALSSYYIGKYEVTQRQWAEIMGANPSRFKGDDLPVETVSWDDVQEFIRKLNALTGKNYRLPTEAEWEFAARGGNSRRGSKYSGSDNIDAVAWYYGNSGSKTHPVGTKSPNELGIYDMSGNVWEWCSDWYGSSYNSNETSNPQGPSSGAGRVLRGGSWRNYARGCRVSNRNYFSPDSRYYDYGFRLVLSL